MTEKTLTREKGNFLNHNIKATNFCVTLQKIQSYIFIFQTIKGYFSIKKSIVINIE